MLSISYLSKTQIPSSPQVLATGLSGLYSSLPRKWPIPADDWYRLTEEDVANTPDLAMFLNSLEFCNAVVQVGQESVMLLRPSNIKLMG